MLSAYGSVFLRLALATAFLSSVADRFGLLGPADRVSWLGGWMGTPSWGDFQGFLDYTAQVGSFLPPELVPLASWMATIAETVLGLALLLGLFTRQAALASGALLFLFGLSMAASSGLKEPLAYSVFTASAGALVLATSLGYRWSVDSVLPPSASPPLWRGSRPRSSDPGVRMSSGAGASQTDSRA